MQVHSIVIRAGSTGTDTALWRYNGDGELIMMFVYFARQASRWHVDDISQIVKTDGCAGTNSEEIIANSSSWYFVNKNKDMTWQFGSPSVPHTAPTLSS